MVLDYRSTCPNKQEHHDDIYKTLSQHHLIDSLNISNNSNNDNRDMNNQHNYT